jgi:hypothetical protein
VEDVLSENQFSSSESENSHQQFWRAITNSPSGLDGQKAANLIGYLLNAIQNHCLLKYEDIGVGLRDDFPFFIVKLLDSVGWSDRDGKHRDNTEKNIGEIAEWVFGEDRHVDSGVIETLGKEDRGILGLHDLLVFRLFCSADRGGDIFNLQRALSKHGDPEAPTTGSIRDIAVGEMREISQRIFRSFEDQYIRSERNIFELVDDLSLADLTGKYYAFVQGKVDSNEVKELDKVTGALKSRIESFIIYQLGNSLVSMGVGCGYYDSVGKLDNHEIQVRINDYLFGVCFNQEKSARNFEHFVDYLLINFATALGSSYGREYVPHADEFTKVLDRRRLADYWRRNAEAVKGLNLQARDKVVLTVNYPATYEKDLPEVYAVLDRLSAEPDEHRQNQAPED